MKKGLRIITFIQANGKLLYSAIVLIFCLLSCTPKGVVRINPDDVEAIKFGGLPRDIIIEAEIRQYGDIAKNVGIYRDTVIKDRKLIERYVSMINSLVPSKDKEVNYEYRIATLIKMNDGLIIPILYGPYNGTSYVGIIMQDRKEIFELLDSIIYKDKPDDYWIDRSLPFYTDGTITENQIEVPSDN